MKAEKVLKISFVILLIILISLISFGGIFIQKMNAVKNILPEYQLGMDLEGNRNVALAVNTTKKTVIYDKDGKVVEKEDEGTTKKEEPINAENTLTKENYLKTKEIVEKRLKAMNVIDYTIRFDEATGKIILQLPENSNTDTVAQYSYIKGKFTVVNDAGDVLMTGADLEKVQVGYANLETGTNVYLTFQFNKGAVEKLKEITKTYVKQIDKDNKDVSKKVTMKIDDSTLLSTSFDEEITNGILQMSIGSTTSSNSELQQYIKEASDLSVLLNNGELPITYTLEANRYVLSDITLDMLFIPAIVIGAIILIALVVLIMKYKKLGLVASIAFIGYIAALLVIIRYTNVMLTMEGLIAILVAIVLNYISNIVILQKVSKDSKTKTKEEFSKDFNKAMLAILLIMIPIIVVAVTLCFAGWLPIYSFGMVMFWGLLLIALYNYIFTRTLIVNSN